MSQLRTIDAPNTHWRTGGEGPDCALGVILHWPAEGYGARTEKAKRTGEPRERRAGTRLTVKQALEDFVRSRTARQRRKARFGLELLEACLNSCAHDSLGGADARLFERLDNAEGEAHREYCEIFGPERIVPELRPFFEWFLIGKVMARAEDLEVVARETSRFVEWLGERGGADLGPGGSGEAACGGVGSVGGGGTGEDGVGDEGDMECLPRGGRDVISCRGEEP